MKQVAANISPLYDATNTKLWRSQKQKWVSKWSRINFLVSAFSERPASPQSRFIQASIDSSCRLANTHRMTVGFWTCWHVGSSVAAASSSPPCTIPHYTSHHRCIITALNCFSNQDKMPSARWIFKLSRRFSPPGCDAILIVFISVKHFDVELHSHDAKQLQLHSH